MIAQNAGAEGSIVLAKVKEAKAQNYGYRMPRASPDCSSPRSAWWWRRRKRSRRPRVRRAAEWEGCIKSRG